MTPVSKQSWDEDYTTGATPWRSQQPDLQHWIENAEVYSGAALDLGCGTGELSIWLAEHGFEVEGVDFSSEALKIAREQSSLPTFVEWDLEDLTNYDFKHESYDLIIDSKVLPFIENKEGYLDTILAWLSGVFILHVIVEHDEKPVYIPQDELETLLNPRFEYKHVEEFTRREGVRFMDYYLVPHS